MANIARQICHRDAQSSCRDRAATTTTAILQIFATASPYELRQAVEQYPRDEIWNIERQAAADRSGSDA